MCTTIRCEAETKGHDAAVCIYGARSKPTRGGNSRPGGCRVHIRGEGQAPVAAETQGCVTVCSTMCSSVLRTVLNIVEHTLSDPLFSIVFHIVLNTKRPDATRCSINAKQTKAMQGSTKQAIQTQVNIVQKPTMSPALHRAYQTMNNTTHN